MFCRTNRKVLPKKKIVAKKLRGFAKRWSLNLLQELSPLINHMHELKNICGKLLDGHYQKNDTNMEKKDFS
jgi:hypothetical protein